MKEQSMVGKGIISFIANIFFNLIKSNLELWAFHKKTYPYINKIMQNKLGGESVENVYQITQILHKISFKTDFVNEYNAQFKKYTKL